MIETEINYLNYNVLGQNNCACTFVGDKIYMNQLQVLMRMGIEHMKVETANLTSKHKLGK